MMMMMISKTRPYRPYHEVTEPAKIVTRVRNGLRSLEAMLHAAYRSLKNSENVACSPYCFFTAKQGCVSSPMTVS